MELSENGKKFIEQWEGRRAKLYDDATGKTIAHARDAAGNPSIGIGHLVSKNDTRYDGVTLTDAAIDKLFSEDIAQSVTYINKIENTVPLNQNQFDALVSFIYNIGPGKAFVKSGLFVLKNGLPSTLYTKLCGLDFSGAAEEFPKWINSNGKPSEGLRRRRLAEQKLFLTPVTPEQKDTPKSWIQRVLDWLLRTVFCYTK